MKTRLIVFLTPLLLLAGFAMAQKPVATPAVPQKPADTAPAASTDTRVIAFQKPSYPLDTCPISHEKLGGMGEPVDVIVDGHLVRLCCGSCKKGVEKDKVAIIKSIEDAVVAQQSVGYPMEACAICDAKMEKPINHVVGTRLVRVCCPECAKTYDSDPAKSSEAMKKLDAAWMSSQKAKYTVTTCPVSGHTLDAKAVDQLYGTKLVRLCCKDCIAELNAKPEVVMAKLAELQKAVPASAPVGGEKKKS
ncbi:MAG TPA: hypothetical protein VK843_15390 [Planctomycetota bacterium]|nr:hypothetical protein [Planctomycetota bacterium]